MNNRAGKFDLIVFDWDGTLMDSAAAIVTAIQAACADLYLPPPSEERARHVIGLSLNEALQELVPQLHHADGLCLAERYRYHFLAADHTLRLFPCMEETLNALKRKGRLLAVATGKSRMGLNRALEHTGIKHYFNTTRCADECFSKPHPAMLEEIMEELGADPSRTLMVGDTVHDLQMAKNARVSGVGVAFGAHSVAALKAESPLACLMTPQELHDWLSENA